MTKATHEQATALYVSAFFDELIRCGVEDVVVSPGSRSTALSMVAHASQMELYVDVDERGAAFFALGLARAKQKPVAVICTSGTALANYYPAVVEAESSRIPLIILSGDRPQRLQHVGAPQTFDQLKAFSDHVEGFWNMPEPSADPKVIAYVRQIAREACIAVGAAGVSRGPVHINFPFDEPLKPDLSVEGVREGSIEGSIEEPIEGPREGLFSVGRIDTPMPALMSAHTELEEEQAAQLLDWLAARRSIILCGEKTFSEHLSPEEQDIEATCLFALAEYLDAPLIADPLSNLRAYNHPAVITTADTLFKGSAAQALPNFDCVIRFGRYPVSKPVTRYLEEHACVQIVVDPIATRDFNAQTSVFVPVTPASFVSTLLDVASLPESPQKTDAGQALHAWGLRQMQAQEKLETVRKAGASDFEGTYIRTVLDAAPQGSLIFSANSMAIRALDMFYTGRDDKQLTLLANRGLNGIDGTVSSALGAAQIYEHTTLVIGDLSLLHDLNALALQAEFERRCAGDETVPPQVTIVLLNNQGGAIFDMLPQKSDEAYFERLFLTPHTTNFEAAAQTFSLEYTRVATADECRVALEKSYEQPGISLIEISLPLEGVTDRYEAYRL